MKNKEDDPFDWQVSVAELAKCPSQDINILANAAKLNPVKGDLSDVDFSEVDLRNQNFDYWDLSYATFRGALVSGADFSKASINLDSLIEAKDWRKAHLSRLQRSYLDIFTDLKRTISDLDLSDTLIYKLQNHGITTFSDIFTASNDYLLKDLYIAERSIRQIWKSFGAYGIECQDMKCDPKFRILMKITRLPGKTFKSCFIISGGINIISSDVEVHEVGWAK